MSDTSQETVTKLRPLETPPRTSGNAQADIPILVDWLYKAYLSIKSAIDFINGQVKDNPNLELTNLPDPANSTIAQAQTTANQAYTLAAKVQDDIQNGHVSGTVTISDTADSATVNLAVNQPDANYRVILQAISFTATPASGAFTVKSKSYSANSFSVTLVAAPGSGNSVTFEWQMIRNI